MLNTNKIFLLLLVFIPVSIAATLLQWGATTAFITAGLAIIPLAAYMGLATEEIAVVTGPSIGGLLNATFGNATELILAYVALSEGLINVVKATITGSIIGNLLLVMGLSMFLGGLRYKEQQFQPITARLNASSMNLAVVALLLPTALDFTSTAVGSGILQRLSVAVAVVLIIVYGLTLLFSMKTHTYLYEVGVIDSEILTTLEPEKSKPKLWFWVFILVLITLRVAVESELLVNSLEEATQVLGFTPLFTGVILLPIIGNAAEHATSIRVALKDKMDLSVSIAVGSSMQIALFVAPVLVIAGWLIGQPMDLNFHPFELVSVAVAVLLANSVSSDGSSNWLEGTLLMATYALLALAFFFVTII